MADAGIHADGGAAAQAAESPEALEALRRYFGYDSFRPGQGRMVEAILSGHDVLGVMPTGAGKSICYQVPALVRPGITFVISPLLSLMSDQVRALKEAGARPSYLNSSLTPGQQNTVLKRAYEGQYRIMYVAPERLAEPRFAEFAHWAASDAGLGVPLVAVDEAHCASQWGQDFRPDYLQIAQFVESLPRRPVVAAFTATATERVRADITQILGLIDPVTAVTGFDRANLFFGVEEMGDRAKETWIRDYAIAHAQDSGIVYCATRKAVDALALSLDRALTPYGIRVGRYHAGMSADERAYNQAAFIDDTAPVIVATNAFGMGIDKPNVRYVIHNNVPESIEAYYQEAGRAGRDGDPASCYLLWNGNDFRLRRYLIDRDREDPEAETAEHAIARQNRYRLLSGMEGYCQTMGCLREYMLRYFGDTGALGVERPGAAHACGNCSNCTTSYEEEDVTQIAAAAVRFVRDTRGRFGRALVADALHGANTERIREYRLDEVADYGALAQEPVGRIKDVIGQLVGRGYLEQSQGRFPVVGLGPRAVEALEVGDGPAFSFAIKRRVRAGGRGARSRRAVDLLRAEAAQDASPRVGDDAALFERLREMRRELACEREVPPYIVASDKTLRGIVRRRPHSIDELLEIAGIGEKKADEYGEEILAAVSAFENLHR